MATVTDRAIGDREAKGPDSTTAAHSRGGTRAAAAHTGPNEGRPDSTNGWSSHVIAPPAGVANVANTPTRHTTVAWPGRPPSVGGH